MRRFYSKGKVMLTGEYMVLKGAQSLALASRLGQHMIVYEDSSWTAEPILIWQASDRDNNIWFEADFQLPDFRIVRSNETGKALLLADILKNAQRLNPDFLKRPWKYRVECSLEFERHWGLGSSSTLLANIAQWANVEAFQLFKRVSEGSGYDIAVASEGTHIIYQLENETPGIQNIEWNPSFADELFFIALGKKQWSERAARTFRKKSIDRSCVEQINAITTSIHQSNDLVGFEALLNEHEQIMSDILGKPSVKTSLFSDYPGVLKSLGAWGGDLILATRVQEGMPYFIDHGFKEIIPYREII